MLAGTGGGEGLAHRPRFLLARQGQVVLVGAASRAALLSETMNSDGSRPLYCFVGWLSKDTGAAVPRLEALEDLWTPWAAAVYEAWMPVDWDKHPTDLGDAHEPPFGGSPWPPESTVPPGPPEVVLGRGLLQSPRGRPITVPVEARADAWRQLYAGPGDFAFAAGPHTSFPDPNGVLTHLAMVGDTDSRADDEGVQPAAGAPAPGRAGPPPDERVPTGPPPTGPSHEASAPEDRMYPRSASGEQPLAVSTPRRDTGHCSHEPSDAKRRPERSGGILRKAGQVLRSIANVPDGSMEDDADEPPAESSTPPTGPMGGPAGDLDYWRRAEAAQAQREGPQKPVPPVEGSR